MKRKIGIFAILLFVCMAFQSLKAQETKTIQEKETSKQSEFSNEEETLPYFKLGTVIDEQPEFPGGEVARVAFISENVKYPEEARKEKLQGLVRVFFIVETDGSISDIKIARGAAPILDEEAMRVVKSMPKWKPGKHEGKEVRVQCCMPITFIM